jgi:hypothetical protein
LRFAFIGRVLSFGGVAVAFGYALVLAGRLQQAPHVQALSPIPILTAPAVGVSAIDVLFVWALAIVSVLGLIVTNPRPMTEEEENQL